MFILKTSKSTCFFYERARNERMPQFRQSASFFADEPGACEKTGEKPGACEKKQVKNQVTVKNQVKNQVLVEKNR